MDQLELFCKEDTTVAKISRKLQQWGCCIRCTLRFLGETQVYIYKQSDQEIKDILEEIDKLYPTENEEKSAESAINITSNDTKNGDDKTNEDVCIACVGILQSYYLSRKFRDEIMEKVEASGHQFATYFCALKLPIPIILREHALWISLEELFKDVYGKERKDDVAGVKDVWKWINGPQLSHMFGVPFDQKSPFEISVNFVHPTDNKECSFLLDLYPDIFRQRKNNKYGWEVFTRTNVLKAVSTTTDSRFKRSYQCPPRKITDKCNCDGITCTHDSLFLAGRYNKYSRFLSQTPWLIGTERKTESSIEELICIKLDERVKSSEYKFSASGREDVDVKMLGTGRPFVVEFINPHIVKLTPQELSELSKEINAATQDVFIRDLQIVTREDTNRLKEGEAEKTKSYTAVCCSDEPITQETLDKLKDIKDLTLKQKTPIRVLHRRPLAVRDKVVHTVSATLIDAQHFRLSLLTQAGTYIKEFVHGDFGRTKPCLGSILNNDCDILELDVESVELDWPKKLDAT